MPITTKRILRTLFLTQKQIHDKDQQNEKSYCLE